MTSSLSAIILAGGQSSRMGRDKALIPIGGVPLLRQVCEVALKCASEVYIVTSWPERYQDIIPSSCQLIREVPLPGETKPSGPLVGFAQGLAQVQTDWVLLLACDMPKLRVEVLQDWATLLENVPEDKIALLPRNPKGWEPLCGFYRRRCLPQLFQSLIGIYPAVPPRNVNILAREVGDCVPHHQENRSHLGGRSFQHWLAQHSVEELPLSDTRLLFNCNTPADLADLDF